MVSRGNAEYRKRLVQCFRPRYVLSSTFGQDVAAFVDLLFGEGSWPAAAAARCRACS